MARTAVLVRPGVTADVPELARLWEQASEVWRRTERSVLPGVLARVEAQLTDLLSDPDAEVLVATVHAEPVGMTILTPTRLGPLWQLPTLQMSYLVVAAGHRRRGVGHALVAAAAAVAEERGFEQILANAIPSNRESNRFLARLGFAPVMVRRAASVAVLKRRLARSERRPMAESLVRRRPVVVASQPARVHEPDPRAVLPEPGPPIR